MGELSWYSCCRLTFNDNKNEPYFLPGFGWYFCSSCSGVGLPIYELLFPLGMYIQCEYRFHGLAVSHPFLLSIQQLDYMKLLKCDASGKRYLPRGLGVFLKDLIFLPQGKTMGLAPVPSTIISWIQNNTKAYCCFPEVIHRPGRACEQTNDLFLVTSSCFYMQTYKLNIYQAFTQYLS